MAVTAMIMMLGANTYLSKILTNLKGITVCTAMPRIGTVPTVKSTST